MGDVLTFVVTTSLFVLLILGPLTLTVEQTNVLGILLGQGELHHVEQGAQDLGDCSRVLTTTTGRSSRGNLDTTLGDK